MRDDDLFRPLSAKTSSRQSFSSSGRAITSRQGDGGTVRKIRAAMARAKADRTRREGTDER